MRMYSSHLTTFLFWGFCSDIEEAVLKLVTFLLPDGYLEGIDRLIELGQFQSRSEAVRIAVKEMMKGELGYTEAKKPIREMPIALPSET